MIDNLARIRVFMLFEYIDSLDQENKQIEFALEKNNIMLDLAKNWHSSNRHSTDGSQYYKNRFGTRCETISMNQQFIS